MLRLSSRSVNLFSPYFGSLVSRSFSSTHYNKLDNNVVTLEKKLPIIPSKTMSKRDSKAPKPVPLSDIIPSVDCSLIDIETLDRLSDWRSSCLNDYFEALDNVRSSHPVLQNNHSFKQFVDILQTVNSQKNILFSIDIEAFERKTNIVTEIGISIYDPFKDATSLIPNVLNIHILLEEHLRFRNGSFVNDNKDNFLGGSSIILKSNEARKFIQTLVDYYFITRQEIGMNGVIAGHNPKGDISWLATMGVRFPTNAQVVDSQKLYNLTDTINRSSLGAILQRLRIPHSHLHNGGNDAYFTLILLMKLSDPNFRAFHNLDSWEANEEYKELFLDRKKNGGIAGRPEVKAKKQMSSEFVPNARFSNFQDALHLIYES